MSKTSGADPITREQVERLLVEVQSTTGLATAQAALGILGNSWLSVCPPYVAEFFDVRVTLPEAFRAALTRWRDELAAAEPVRRVARWDAALGHYVLTPPITSDYRATTDPYAAIAWGYEIEGGPASAPAEDSPERLRERRERLGLSMFDAADLAKISIDDVDALEGTCRRWPDCDRCGEMRPAYAAALSAEEARLARDEPERPSPRFKVGEWARDRDTVFRVAEMHWDDDRWYARPVAGVRDGIAEYSLQPASPPAPEVVDVPQPAPVPKTVAHFYTIRALPETHRVSWNMPTDGPQWVRVNDALWLHVDDLRAMLADIDAQQGGAS